MAKLSVLGLVLISWVLASSLQAQTASFPITEYIRENLDLSHGEAVNPAESQFRIYNRPVSAPPRPIGLKLPESADSVSVLASFLGLPFRFDGVVSDEGAWTTWQNPGKALATPGLNCSGFVAAAGRFLLNRNLRLDDLRRDRESNSGAGSDQGFDWDFGLDVVLNLAEGHFLRYLPQPAVPTLTYNEAGQPLGWGLDIHSHRLEEVLRLFQPGRIYLFAISKPDRRFAGGLSYYHVGIVMPEATGEIWLYHATKNAGVHRLNLASPKSLATFRRYFPKVRSGERRIQFLELDPLSR
ncbi:MAG: hypothetical protein LBP22_01660 [Deltaproteobacteria bacterium]|jgi:cell wall-associated NlpC family hydrolase|nr:hypothetical protein [Deltaproteobacteria bacterium]